MPMPAFAPSRQRSPIEMTSVAAAGQGAHDRGAAADVGVAADDHAGGDPALDHRGAQRAGVVVDEALVHHGGAGGEVGAQPDPVGVGDPYARRQHVVDHPRELVHPVHGHDAVPRPAAGTGRARSPPPRTVPPRSTPRWAGAPKMPVQVDRPRRDQPVAEQVQPQVGVRGVGRGSVQVDLPPGGPRSRTPRSSSRRWAATRSAGDVLLGRRAQGRGREVGVQHTGRAVHGGQSPAPGRAGRGLGGGSRSARPDQSRRRPTGRPGRWRSPVG